MAFVLEPPDGRLNFIPAPFIVKPRFNEICNERTPFTSTNASIKLGDEVIGERYVYSHGLRIAHRSRGGRRLPASIATHYGSLFS